MSWYVERGPTADRVYTRVATLPTLGAALYAACALLPAEAHTFVAVRPSGAPSLAPVRLTRLADGTCAVTGCTLPTPVLAHELDHQALRTELAREALDATVATAALPRPTPHTEVRVRVRVVAGQGWEAALAVGRELVLLTGWLPTEAAACAELAESITRHWPAVRDARPS